MSSGFLLIDVNNLGFAAQSKQKLTVNDMEVQAIFGVIRSIRSIKSMYPNMTPLILHDGKSWRHKAFAEYKANRDEVKYECDKKKIANREAYKAQKPYIKRALAALGVTQISAFNMEADDLAAILIRKYQPQGKKIMMISGDKDWLQLIGPGVGWRDPVRNRRITMKNLEEETGLASTEQFLEWKAIVGDKGDNIPGVDGIGEKGAVDFLKKYDSVKNFIIQTLDGTIDTTKLPKKYRRFAEDEKLHIQFETAMMLMDLNSKHIPAPAGLKVTKGDLDTEAFEEICRELSFKSILQQMPQWAEPFERKTA
ncbi:MAG: hypothetical protein JJ979_03575 [Roseibium sp.]|nr:hypothetical protein [Roseibium sp.]